MADSGPAKNPGDPIGEDWDGKIPFSGVRRIDLDPELVASRQLANAIARIEEDGAGEDGVILTAIGHLAQAILSVEKQLVELRKRLDG